MTKYLMTVLIVISSLSVIFGFSLPMPTQIGDKAPQTPDTRKTQKRQEGAKPSPDVIGYWQALAARSKGPLAVNWNERSGTPKSIIGKVSAPVSGASEAAARSFLVGNSPLFKMTGDTGDLDLARSFDSLIGEHFVFEQTYRGVPVYGAEVAIHFDRAGDIVSVNNSYQPGVALKSVAPKLNRGDAFARALSVVKNAASKSEGKLVVLGLDDSFALAWRFVVSTEGPTWEIFVDAEDGKLLTTPRDLNRYLNGTGQVYNINAIVATQDNSLRDNADAASAVPASAYRIVTLQGLVGNGFLDGDFASSSKTRKRATDAAHNFIFDRSSDGFSETMGYYYIDYAERYIQSLGFNNVNNRQQVFAVNRLKIDNSFYSPSSLEISLGLGGVDDAEDAEVILHEYGHSIQDNQVPNFGSSLEGGSMGEGFGDYWGASIGAQFSGGFQDVCLAEWDATSYSSSNPPCLRRLDGTKHYPEDAVGQVHADGEIWSAALWQIRGAIGAANADRVVIASHFLLSPTASFNQGANALVMAGINLGYGNRQLNQMRNILRDRGFTVSV
ncbi:MAG: M36 family metallopeptidase [Pyrinomonadaceae bacterium]